MKIYLASPYSNDRQWVRTTRYNKALTHTGLLMEAGHIVYSPIVHNHVIADCYDLPKGWEYWEEADTSFIEWCEILVILMLGGWRESTGIKAEKEIAINMLKPVIHWNPDSRMPDLPDLQGGT